MALGQGRRERSWRSIGAADLAHGALERALRQGAAEGVERAEVLRRCAHPCRQVLVDRARAGDALVPIVIDLGIARALADPWTEADVALRRAMNGAPGLGPVGTSSSMIPEQAAGGADVDERRWWRPCAATRARCSRRETTTTSRGSAAT